MVLFEVLEMVRNENGKVNATLSPLSTAHIVATAHVGEGVCAVVVIRLSTGACETVVLTDATSRRELI